MNHVLETKINICKAYKDGYITESEKDELLQMICEDTMYFPKKAHATTMYTNFNIWYKAVVSEAMKRRDYEHN